MRFDSQERKKHPLHLEGGWHCISSSLLLVWFSWLTHRTAWERPWLFGEDHDWVSSLAPWEASANNQDAARRSEWEQPSGFDLSAPSCELHFFVYIHSCSEGQLPVIKRRTKLEYLENSVLQALLTLHTGLIFKGCVIKCSTLL